MKHRWKEVHMQLDCVCTARFCYGYEHKYIALSITYSPSKPAKFFKLLIEGTSTSIEDWPDALNHLTTQTDENMERAIWRLLSRRYALHYAKLPSPR